ncbi:MAG: hypothetical protein ACKVHU_18455 [Acidimicrobiales bacterium]
MSIDVRENRIRVDVTDGDSGELVGSLAQRSADGVPFDITVVPAISTTDTLIYGGTNLTSPCTVGFVFRRDYEYGGGFAEHCNPGFNSTIQTTFETLWRRWGQWSGSLDFKFASAQGNTTITNLFFDGTVFRSPSGYRARLAQPVGSIVCKYGNATGTTCGFLRERSKWLPQTVPGSYWTWMRVEKIGAGPISSAGDSGGPWFVGSEAWGILHGHQGQFGHYMAINYALQQGTTLALTTPAIQLLYNPYFGSVANWGQIPAGSHMNWALYSPYFGKGNSLEFNCAGQGTLCSVYSDRPMLLNQLADYDVSTELYCNDSVPCQAHVRLWGLWGQVTETSQYVWMPPHSWVTVSFRAEVLQNHAGNSALRFEIYNYSANQNIGVHNPNVHTVNYPA